MSLQIGQYGSLLRDDYVQPPVRAHNPNTNFVSLGAYLQPGPYASLSLEDPSRFRPGTFVAPTQIELMQGFMDTPFQNADPVQSDTRVVPGNTFVTQRPAPRGLSSARGGADPEPFSSSAAPRGYTFVTTSAGNVRSGGPRASAGLGGAGGGTRALETAPYGLVVGAPVSPANCPSGDHCALTVAGGCACSAQSPWYDPARSNVYY